MSEINDAVNLLSLFQASKNCGYGRSFFERLLQNGYSADLLGVQYRMHPEISRFQNRKFYDGHVRNGSNVIGSHYTTFFNKVPYSFIDVPHGREDDGSGGKRGSDHGTSLGNRAEVEVIQSLLAILGNGPWRGSLTEHYFHVLCHHCITRFAMYSKLHPHVAPMWQVLSLQETRVVVSFMMTSTTSSFPKVVWFRREGKGSGDRSHHAVRTPSWGGQASIEVHKAGHRGEVGGRIPRKVRNILHGTHVCIYICII